MRRWGQSLRWRCLMIMICEECGWFDLGVRCVCASCMEKRSFVSYRERLLMSIFLVGLSATWGGV